MRKRIGTTEPIGDMKPKVAFLSLGPGKRSSHNEAISDSSGMRNSRRATKSKSELTPVLSALEAVTRNPKVIA